MVHNMDSISRLNSLGNINCKSVQYIETVEYDFAVILKYNSF